MDVRVVDHPLVAARLTTLRDERTDNAAFRAALRDLTLMLVYEATRDAACETVPVRTPLAVTTGSRVATTSRGPDVSSIQPGEGFWAQFPPLAPALRQKRSARHLLLTTAPKAPECSIPHYIARVTFQLALVTTLATTAPAQQPATGGTAGA